MSPIQAKNCYIIELNIYLRTESSLTPSCRFYNILYPFNIPIGLRGLKLPDEVQVMTMLLLTSQLTLRLELLEFSVCFQLVVVQVSMELVSNRFLVVATSPKTFFIDAVFLGHTRC